MTDMNMFDEVKAMHGLDEAASKRMEALAYITTASLSHHVMLFKAGLMSSHAVSNEGAALIDSLHALGASAEEMEMLDDFVEVFFRAQL